MRYIHALLSRTSLRCALLPFYWCAFVCATGSFVFHTSWRRPSCQRGACGLSQAAEHPWPVCVLAVAAASRGNASTVSRSHILCELLPLLPLLLPTFALKRHFLVSTVA